MHRATPEMAASRSNKATGLLTAGVVAGPLFYAAILLQVWTRSGFDVLRHPVSLLSLGDAGWIQRTNFIVTGILALTAAAGFKRTLRSGVGAMWVPMLVGFFGAGTIVAGLFEPDAAFGFPPGTPPGIPAHVSVHSMLHGVGFDLAFLSLIVACFIMARRFSKLSRPKWRTYSFATGVVTLMLIAAGMTAQPVMGLLFFLAGAVAFAWLTAVALTERAAADLRQSLTCTANPQPNPQSV